MQFNAAGVVSVADRDAPLPGRAQPPHRRQGRLRLQRRRRPRHPAGRPASSAATPTTSSRSTSSTCASRPRRSTQAAHRRLARDPDVTGGQHLHGRQHRRPRRTRRRVPRARDHRLQVQPRRHRTPTAPASSTRRDGRDQPRRRRGTRSTPRATAAIDARVVYTVSGGPAIGGLFNGQHVWIVLENVSGFAAGDHMIRLADSACHAGIGTYDPTPGGRDNADNNTPCSTRSSRSSPWCPTPRPPVSRPTTGSAASATSRSASSKATCTSSTCSNGTQFQLRDAPAPCRPGSSTSSARTACQRGHRDRLGRHRHAAALPRPAGRRPRRRAARAHRRRRPGRTARRPGGSVNGVAERHLDRHRRRRVRLQDVFSEVDVRPTVDVDVQGGTLRGGSVKIGGTSYANAAVSSVGQGRRIRRVRRLERQRRRREHRLGDPRRRRADLLLERHRDHGARLHHRERRGRQPHRRPHRRRRHRRRPRDSASTSSTDVAGDLFANRTVLDRRRRRIRRARRRASSGSGGLGTNADANDDSGQGVQIGHDHAASVTTTVAGTGEHPRRRQSSSRPASARQYTVNGANGDIQSALARGPRHRTVRRRRLRARRRLRRRRLRRAQRARPRSALADRTPRSRAPTSSSAPRTRTSTCRPTRTRTAAAAAATPTPAPSVTSPRRLARRRRRRVRHPHRGPARRGVPVLLEALRARAPLGRLFDFGSADADLQLRSRSATSCGSRRSTCSASRTRSSSSTRAARSSRRPTTSPCARTQFGARARHRRHDHAAARSGSTRSSTTRSPRRSSRRTTRRRLRRRLQRAHPRHPGHLLHAGDLELGADPQLVRQGDRPRRAPPARRACRSTR